MSYDCDLDRDETLELFFQQRPGSLPHEDFSDGIEFLKDWGLSEHDMLNDHDTEDFFNSILGSFDDETPVPVSSSLDSDSGISEDNNHCAHEDSPSRSDITLSEIINSEVINSDHNYSLSQNSQNNANCLHSVKTEKPSLERDISIVLEDWEPDCLIENPQVLPVEKSTGLVTLTIEDLQQYSKTNQHCFEELILTDEEKRLLSKDGVQLPTCLPLTKSEERALKRIRRKIRNKQSAQESRKKKKNYIDGLESRVVACTVQNQELQRKVQHLENQNMSLIEQLRKLQALVKHTSTKSANISTCIMVFLLSFTLIIFPSINPFGAKLRSQEESYSVLSRTLLDSESSHVRLVSKAHNPGSDPEIMENAGLDQEVPQTLMSTSQNRTPESSDLGKSESTSTLSSNSSSDVDRIIKAAAQSEISLGRTAPKSEKDDYSISSKPNWTEHSATVIIKTHPRSDEM
ncbi:cAMP responsive element binding protein 3-like 3 like isoform X1 [Hypanus sabinus]|uniref:cAMP responsive element binding protein 3-like 3 like isoform X1 n=1 Tax=Hypanus sabinus TaxID=79690 RepID=UPI0028C4211A|nr:cAMP responsive element binding protein 3-like 3 like isoform X1 [Hypanus sabinus]XP_059845540.1 cAMP responsive element binding protein 3-like 3 like isoform X1 [Hypanus sabinus]XP_059845541.1 cAMP responsive element binding protein 3-like 3 like isoform X1 [Hypanus sabinus]XP_059845542.1 cAMP responsive element binding protein 3-like 3 like isoform X1 [Hypanus sabinus]XP_059845543.1 cAMP responsive element binding protein 3-like 3 like isoform X1 [Hypanus sabinus]